MKLVPSNVNFNLPYNDSELASFYPLVDEIAVIDEIGEITDEFLDSIVTNGYKCTPDEMARLFKALGGLKHKRLWEVADYFLRSCTYIRYFEPESIAAIIKALLKLPRTEELEQYLITILTEFEDEYSVVRDIILGYL